MKMMFGFAGVPAAESARGSAITHATTATNPRIKRWSDFISKFPFQLPQKCSKRAKLFAFFCAFRGSSQLLGLFLPRLFRCHRSRFTGSFRVLGLEPSVVR